SQLDTTLRVGEEAWPVRVAGLDGDPARAAISVPDITRTPPPRAQEQLKAQVRHMLRLDEDMTAFYAVAAADPALAWVLPGAGRMLRSPTVFEDLVKTICTTNCAWSGTVRMVSSIVQEL